MVIKSAEFYISSPGLKKCPPYDKPEYAFIGRSNVGKSTLINMITGRKGLAKTSSKPGKTRLINYFLINSEWYLVDLPGYGYAVISKKEREAWKKMIREYLLKRKSLMSTFLLIDTRIPPQESDLDYISWFGANNLPVVLVFTKSDKQSSLRLQNWLIEYEKILNRTWSELPPVIISSGQSGIGKEEILDYIEQSNEYFNPDLLQFDK
jgi:GTP-binding protein